MLPYKLEFLPPCHMTRLTVRNSEFIFISSCLILLFNKYSNSNDIETKRNDTSIIGVFSVEAKRTQLFQNSLDRREEKANIISLRSCIIEADDQT